MLYALEAFVRLCRTLYRRQLRTKSYDKELLGFSFKPRRFAFKKDAVPMIFNFPMKCCKPSIGQTETAKNKRIMLSEQRVNC